MVSDLLADFVSDLDYYLNDPAFEKAYVGELRAAILLIRRLSEDVRRLLDGPPEGIKGGYLPQGSLSSMAVRRVLDQIDHPLRKEGSG